MEIENAYSNSKKFIIIGLIAVVVLLAIGIWAWQKNKKSVVELNDDINTIPKTDLINNSPPPAIVSSKYKYGTFTADGKYISPAGPESITISATIKDDFITDSTFLGHGIAATTKKMQAKFSEGFKEQVIGKLIDNVNLTVVNGSSLTPQGFMDALEKIKIQAEIKG